MQSCILPFARRESDWIGHDRIAASTGNACGLKVDC